MAQSPDDTTSEHASTLTAPLLDIDTAGLPEEPFISEAELRQHADGLIARWQPLPASATYNDLLNRIKELRVRLKECLRRCRRTASSNKATPQLEILESGRMLQFAIPTEEIAAAAFRRLPHVRVSSNDDLPQVIHLAMGYLSCVRGIWSPDSLAVYVEQVQRHYPLQLEEIRLLPESLRLAQLQFILDRADEAFASSELPPMERSPFSAPIHSLRRLNQAEWPRILEHLVPFDRILRLDPSQVYPAMEEDTRSTYHRRVAELAKYADASEVETAQIALDLSRESASVDHREVRIAMRKKHIGYYLFAEGLDQLKPRIGYHPPGIERIRSFIRHNNAEFYILCSFILSVLLITALILPLVPRHEFWAVMGALLFALLPATQGAVDLVNATVNALFKAEPLPKIDFSKGVPNDSTTFVVVPTLLMHEEQVGQLIEELEARYLSNQDSHIHFGLLTDLPDSTARPAAEDNNPLVQMAAKAIEDLNVKYADEHGGAFFLLHRHRIFNARQGVWMGWERKRGKLLDLNKLLLHEFDSFPIKAGPLHLLEDVRFVITLDSDTQLPRGTARRMVGTIMHPLNRAIVSPRDRIVTAGYGILQPRVGVSVSSASTSRLASLYSGETGFDIYARAISDVYQDLFGEGIFTGKGIYEVRIFHDVLNHRFPRNALLSHDLIEGAYVRAGLVTDVEVIDDYPSHYSAHTRRKHRWVRGDWQITRWLLSRVPDESGRLVPNPISTISRWKILDNLRRSLIEPITFLLFVFGWFFLPGGALYWTLATLVLFLLPGLVQLAFNLGRAVLNGSIIAAEEGLSTFAASLGITLLNLIFLPHHMMLSLDAIVRSLNRTFISGRHLLDWETAAQSESRNSKTSLDFYLKLSPAVALVLAVALIPHHARALFSAAPILALWALAPVAVTWLNSSPTRAKGPLSSSDTAFLQKQALNIWRYYAEFGGRENHWLIPDNVEEKDTLQVRKLSPTNLGMLFNARQAAYEFGFITLPEFVEASLGTLTTYKRLEKQRGHIYNWYDIENLKPVPPFTVSAVDSGNLAASLYTLHAGALDLLKRPLLNVEAFTALEVFASEAPGHRRTTSIRDHVRLLEKGNPGVARSGPEEPAGLRVQGRGDKWLANERSLRHAALSRFINQYLPWLLPKFEPLFDIPHVRLADDEQTPTLETAVAYTIRLDERLASLALAQPESTAVVSLAMELRDLLSSARGHLTQLREDIVSIATEAEHNANAMDFSFLLEKSRQLLSIGYDGVTGELNTACYDLLASEARIASFLAVAKGDVPQQAWFRLDRSHVLVKGRASLISWTGTMFEYMMPALWMRSYAGTLISRSLESVSYIQRDHVREIPWGISESGCARMDNSGRYGYQAWGIPTLALKYGAEDGPVISPYSTFLAMPFSRDEALANLRRMSRLGWEGAYGFYEAADYTTGSEPTIVRSWMAHHQGMSLLAITNLLRENIFQSWFHANPIVRATELLLHEKPLSKVTLSRLAKRSTAADSNETTAKHAASQA